MKVSSQNIIHQYLPSNVELSNELKIPWGINGIVSPKSETAKLLEECGTESDVSELVFVNDNPILPSRLHLGYTSAIALGAFAQLIIRIAKSRKIETRKAIVDIMGSELSLLGVLAAQVNSQGIFKGFFSPCALNHLRKQNMLKSGAFMRVTKTADKKWFHTHGNFDASSIQSVLDCSAIPHSINRAVGQWNSHELEDALAQSGASGTIFRTPEEWIETPQGQHLLNTPTIEIIKISNGKPHPLSPNTDQPLGGVRILDLTRVLAGPAATRLLCEQGADCLKITAPHLPYYPFFAKVENVGKRSASIDLRDKHQRDKLIGLARDCDVFVTSYRTGALTKYGLSPEEIADKHSRGLIYLSISCYGSGPWENRPGFDSLAQAATGFALAHSSTSLTNKVETINGKAIVDTAPQFVPMSAPNDYITAYLAATGVLAALHRRAVEGGSYHVKVSLSQSAMWTLGFGYRDCSDNSNSSTAQMGIWERFIRRYFSYIDFPALTKAKAYLQEEPSSFGKIKLLRTPIEFTGNGIRPEYQVPAVRFGTHRPEWD